LERVISKLLAKVDFIGGRWRELAIGEVAERLKAPLSKSGRQQCLVGSNPTLSADCDQRHERVDRARLT
jgi:hypothetical protein